MPGKNGRGATIIAWVQQHPGCTAKEIGAALGFDHNSGLLGYLRQTGKIHGAGPRHWTRFYPTAAEAQANHDRVAAEAITTRDAKAIQARKDSEVYRMQRRHAKAAIRRRNAARRAARKAAVRAALAAERKAQRKIAEAAKQAAKAAQRARVAAAKAVLGTLPRGVKIAPHVKVTIAQTPPPRFAPTPGFVGAISSDYVMRRQVANAG